MNVSIDSVNENGISFLAVHGSPLPFVAAVMRGAGSDLVIEVKERNVGGGGR